MVQAIVKKNEWNNEQSKHNMPFKMPFQILWSWDIKYRSKPNICGKNMILIHYWPFKVQITTQTLQSRIIITQAERDNAVGSASDCRSGNTSSSLSSAT